MALPRLFHRKWTLWIQVAALLVALGGVLFLMSYLRSGELEKSPTVQGFMNPEQDRTARVIVEKPGASSTTAPSQVPPAKDR
jgi:hypothetical protein